MRSTALVILCLFAAIVRADFPVPRVSDATEPFPAVRIMKLEYDQPRPLRAWAVRIDLTNPDVEFVVTPRTKVEAPYHVQCMTTLAFAEEQHIQLAINGSPYAPLRSKNLEPMKITGLNLSRGDLVAPAHDKPSYAALLIGGDNRTSIRPGPVSAADISAARHGLGGFSIVVKGGVNVMAAEQPTAAKHPRTAIGTSDDGKYQWWLVVDGRQATTSEGLSYAELGELAKSLGITELLNLDGGGSTTLVMQQPDDKHAVVNTPVGRGAPGSLRFNGNNLGLRIYHRPGDLTAAQLRAIMPHLSAARTPLFLGPLNRAMSAAHIDSPIRRAAFLAQLAHESGELKYMEEIASGEAYEGRASLGNTQPGDGKRYKGRGPIQLTGRANYRKAGAALGMDLEGEPTRVADAEVGCRVAGWFWETHGLNALADAGDFLTITRRINGGTNGLARREAFYVRAKDALGVK